MEHKVTPRLLLTSVFGPFGRRDRFADDLGMQMELFNNQITREQGVHSLRTNFWSFSLYFLAENISIPCTVLDFPKWRDFTEELKKGYTHVGISFIQPNVLKVKRMAEFIRAKYPDMRILLGGYGASLPDLNELVPHDALCQGEGIRWLREYFGEDPGAEIKHPVMFGVSQKHLYGFRDVITDSSVIFPGLGCVNRCFFCSTSHKFKDYIPFLPTGESMFSACLEAEKKLGVSSFAIIDENFLKVPDRAKELLRLMEKKGKPYLFAMFSSAEAIRDLGVDFLVRLGVSAVWMGVESNKILFGKVEGIDVQALVHELQSKGVSVISSSILFLEHHDKQALKADVDWAISLGTDMHQFMQLIPFPGTTLYEKYVSEGKLIPKFPYTKLHGQDRLPFVHPNFLPGEAREITRRAFQKKYEADGPGVINMALTAIRGYRREIRDSKERQRGRLSWNPETLSYGQSDQSCGDPFMAMRLGRMKERALELRPILLAGKVFSPNRACRKKAEQVRALYKETFGKPRPLDRVKSLAILGHAAVEWVRILWSRKRAGGDLVRQPPSRRIEYRAAAPSLPELFEG